MVLKSYLTLNYNCSNKKKKYKSTSRLTLKKNSPGRGPETNILEVSLSFLQGSHFLNAFKKLNLPPVTNTQLHKTFKVPKNAQRTMLPGDHP